MIRRLIMMVALAASADMRLALALLLRRTTCRLFVLGAAKIAPVAPLAFVFGAAGFLQGYRDRLATTLDLAAFSAAAALEFAVLEFMHHSAGYPTLPRGCGCH